MSEDQLQWLYRSDRAMRKIAVRRTAELACSHLRRGGWVASAVATQRYQKERSKSCDPGWRGAVSALAR